MTVHARTEAICMRLPLAKEHPHTSQAALTEGSCIFYIPGKRNLSPEIHEIDIHTHPE